MNREEFLQAEDIALYEAPPKVLQKLGEVILYAIVAPYGSGKDSIINWLVVHRPDKFAPIIGDTTRPPRPGEVDGVEYHFRTEADMIDDLRNSRFVQVAPGFSGNFYGTRPEQYPADRIGLRPVQAREMAKFAGFGFKDLKWLQIVPHSDEAWLTWQSDRTYSPRDEAERLEEAIQSYALALTNPKVRYILNDEVEKASQRILRLAEGRLVPDEVRAKQIALRNLQALKKRRQT